MVPLAEGHIYKRKEMMVDISSLWFFGANGTLDHIGCQLGHTSEETTYAIEAVPGWVKP